MIIGFDADQDCARVAHAAKAKGASFVCRYLKNLTTVEREALHAAGLAIVLIFESTADRAMGGAPSGATDGARALNQAKALGAPEGAAIYATADFDPTPAQEDDVLAYFAGFRTQIRGLTATSGDLNTFSGFALGIYASGAICQLALDQSVADYAWLAGGLRMRGSQAFHDTGRAAIEQDVGDKRGLDLGIGIDSDIALVEDYGSWQQPPAQAVSPPPPISPQRVLRLTDPPTTGPDVGHLQSQLASLGFDPGTIDGVFGKRTAAAVRALQTARGLTEDGIAGPQVWRSIT